MKKVLVPTDFSVNSQAGVRFAIHWSTQQKLELVFTHVLHVWRPTDWTDAYFAKHAEQEGKVYKTKLEQFIAGIYDKMSIKPGTHSFEIIQGYSADISILDYCRKKRDIDYVCISTRGAGKFDKIFGTNTGNLITKSEVPILAVPKAYKEADIKSVLYSSDFRNYAEELEKVVDFAMPVKAAIEVLHIAWPYEIMLEEKTVELALKKKYKYGLKVHLEKNDAVHSLVRNIQDQIKLKKPSILVMFTFKERTFFQRLFLSSKAEDLSFDVKVPMLVFGKT